MRLASLLICLVSFAGCSTHVAPVSDRSATKKSSKKRHYKRGRIHIVKNGETLFSIAQRYGIDYHRLAVWNGIDRNYSIYKGQRLRLTAPPRKRWQRAARNSGKNDKTARSSGKQGNKAGSRKQVTELPGVTRGKVTWRWPTNGTIVKNFTWVGSGKKGISIAGKHGQPIVAAADGVVIYTGNWILRYGKLLIIRHNQHFLSTYAHNRKIYVKRGVKVKAGQKIADMGSTGAKRSMLHFEIRYRGKPVNPLRYLPRRK